MTHKRGIRPYWQTIEHTIGELLRRGRSTFYPGHSYGTRCSQALLRSFGLVDDGYGFWRPGPGTYAAIERHIERKLRAEAQLRGGEFPHGFELRNDTRGRSGRAYERRRRARVRAMKHRARTTAA